MDDTSAILAIKGLIAERWPNCMCGTQPGDPAPNVIFGAEAQAFITRGPFTDMGVPTGEPGSFYFHADAPCELAALLLAFARAVSSQEAATQ